MNLATLIHAKWGGLLAAGLLLAAGPAAAEEFGDISADANAIYTGNTFHGYAEIRVVLGNKSDLRAHDITLVYPGQTYGNYGNIIERLSRSVKLDAGAREVVDLLQPPLPADGDGMIRVEVDGERVGQIRAPNNNGHCHTYSGRAETPTVLVSRNLDFDAVERLFHANSTAWTAIKAVGPPDFNGSAPEQESCWMPDTRLFGGGNWLELDYATPQIVSGVMICAPRSLTSLHSTSPRFTPISAGTVNLIGVSGTNLASISFSTGVGTSTGTGWTLNFSFPPTTQPVKTVRLNFGKAPPYNLMIDAVQISAPGPAGVQWASDARASSDNSATTVAYSPGRPSGAATVESLRAESPVTEWSENWLAYSPFDAVVISSADLAALPPAVFAALGDYLYAGGNVVLLGQSELPPAWHAAWKKYPPGGVDYSVGFGDCFALSAGNASGLNPQTAQALRTGLQETARYWQSLPGDSGGANGALPVVDNLKIPTRGIVFIMLAFVVFIGPVNLMYLHRRNRRTAILWTIPAISFVTTMLVFGYSLLREGITPDTRIAGLTFLDQSSHRAATIGGEGFYCPLTPSGGLQFDYETEATPLVDLGYSRSGTSREMDWTGSQHLMHGWVTARVPSHFHVRKTETRRERIQVMHDHGLLKIENSLGAPIKLIWVADADHKIYEANNVEAGQIGALITSAEVVGAKEYGAEGLLREVTFAGHTEGLPADVGKYLSPGTYVAILDGNPFLENALGPSASAKRTKASAVVFGILETETPDP